MSVKQVNMNVEEMKDFLRHIVKNNEYLQESGKIPVAVSISGESGLGKTSAALQLSEELKRDCVKLNLSQIDEIGDIVGFPIRQFQLCKTVDRKMEVGGVSSVKSTKECLWIDEPALPEYMKQGYAFTGEKRMSYCPPEWIAGRTNGGFLILDDYTRCEQRFMQACMELIDRQTYISWSLPKGWTILLTENPDNGSYHVNSMDIAQTTRFVSVNLKFDKDCWASWAEKVQIDSRCINFLLLHPEVITDKVNPRSITTFFNCISSIKDFDKNLPLIQMIGEGSVGGEVSTLFTMFINNKLDSMISPKEVLFNPDEDKIFSQIRSLVGLNKTYRSDIASVLSTRVVNYGLLYAETNSVSVDIIDRIIKLVTIEESFTEDLKYVIVKKFLAGNKLKFQRITNNAKVIAMAMK